MKKIKQKNIIEYDYENEILINEDQLEAEWRNHPQLVLKYQKAKANALRVLEEAKENFNIIGAEVDTAIREEFAENGESKPTERAIDKMVTTNEDVMAARAAVIDANHQYNMLTAACDAFNTRTQSLQNLVKLYTMGYYAESSDKMLDRGTKERLQQKTRQEKLKDREKRRGSIADKLPVNKKRKKLVE